MKEQNRDHWAMGHIAREWFEVQLKASIEARRPSCVKMYERHLRKLDDSQNMAQIDLVNGGVPDY